MERKAVAGVARTETKPYLLTEKEVNLIELCRDLAYGQCTVFLENGEPVRVVEIKKSRKL